MPDPVQIKPGLVHQLGEVPPFFRLHLPKGITAVDLPQFLLGLANRRLPSDQHLREEPQNPPFLLPLLVAKEGKLVVEGNQGGGFHVDARPRTGSFQDDPRKGADRVLADQQGEAPAPQAQDLLLKDGAELGIVEDRLSAGADLSQPLLDAAADPGQLRRGPVVEPPLVVQDGQLPKLLGKVPEPPDPGGELGALLPIRLQGLAHSRRQHQQAPRAKQLLPGQDRRLPGILQERQEAARPGIPGERPFPVGPAPVGPEQFLPSPHLDRIGGRAKIGEGGDAHVGAASSGQLRQDVVDLQKAQGTFVWDHGFSSPEGSIGRARRG